MLERSSERPDDALALLIARTRTCRAISDAEIAPAPGHRRGRIGGRLPRLRFEQASTREARGRRAHTARIGRSPSARGAAARAEEPTGSARASNPCCARGCRSRAPAPAARSRRPGALARWSATSTPTAPDDAPLLGAEIADLRLAHAIGAGGDPLVRGAAPPRCPATVTHLRATRPALDEGARTGTGRGLGRAPPPASTTARRMRPLLVAWPRSTRSPSSLAPTSRSVALDLCWLHAPATWRGARLARLYQQNRGRRVDAVVDLWRNHKAAPSPRPAGAGRLVLGPHPLSDLRRTLPSPPRLKPRGKARRPAV